MGYQCPDCAELHEQAWEAGLGFFLRCAGCVLDEERRAASAAAELAA